MGRSPVLGPPKTDAGIRTLAIPANIISAVRDHLERFTGAEPEAWLFATATGTPLSPRNFNRAWSEARRERADPISTSTISAIPV